MGKDFKYDDLVKMMEAEDAATAANTSSVAPPSATSSSSMTPTDHSPRSSSRPQVTTLAATAKNTTASSTSAVVSNVQEPLTATSAELSSGGSTATNPPSEVTIENQKVDVPSKAEAVQTSTAPKPTVPSAVTLESKEDTITAKTESTVPITKSSSTESLSQLAVPPTPPLSVDVPVLAPVTVVPTEALPPTPTSSEIGTTLTEEAQNLKPSVNSHINEPSKDVLEGTKQIISPRGPLSKLSPQSQDHPTIPLTEGASTSSEELSSHPLQQSSVSEPTKLTHTISSILDQFIEVSSTSNNNNSENQSNNNLKNNLTNNVNNLTNNLSNSSNLNSNTSTQSAPQSPGESSVATVNSFKTLKRTPSSSSAAKQKGLLGSQRGTIMVGSPQSPPPLQKSSMPTTGTGAEASSQKVTSPTPVRNTTTISNALATPLSQALREEAEPSRISCITATPIQQISQNSDAISSLLKQLDQPKTPTSSAMPSLPLTGYHFFRVDEKKDLLLTSI